MSTLTMRRRTSRSMPTRRTCSDHVGGTSLLGLPACMSFSGFLERRGKQETGVRSSALFIFRSALSPLFLIDYFFQYIKCTKMQLALHVPGM